MLSATTNEALLFLTELYHNGRHYSVLKTCRSVLSVILPTTNGIPFGELPIVRKFMKGVANLRPCFPKYSSVWDVKIILDIYRNMPENNELSLKVLTRKLTVLLCLVLCQRAQTVHTFDIHYLKVREDGIHIAFPTKLKQTRVGYHPAPIFIKRFHPEPKICPHNCLRQYLESTKPLRGNKTKLLLSYIKPYQEIGSKTVSRWLKESLAEAGIDITLFQGHSVQVAASSAARQSGVPRANILKMGGWSNDKVFAKH